MSLYGGLFKVPDKLGDDFDIPSQFYFKELGDVEETGWKKYLFFSREPLMGEDAELHHSVENTNFNYPVYIRRSQSRLLIGSKNTSIVKALLSTELFSKGLELSFRNRVQVRIKPIVDRFQNYKAYYDSLKELEQNLSMEFENTQSLQVSERLGEIQNELQQLDRLPINLENITLSMIMGSTPQYGNMLKNVKLTGHDICNTSLYSELTDKYRMSINRCSLELDQNWLLTISSYGDVTFTQNSNKLADVTRIIGLFKLWKVLIL